MSGRLVPFVAMVLLFAVLPFLGSGTPRTPSTSVVLAAGTPTPVDGGVQSLGGGAEQLSATGTVGPATMAMAPAGSAFSSALGGGLFMFPAISLVPVTAEAVAAPITGVPLFIHPVPGAEVSPFGPRIHPVLGRPMFHTGIDLAAPCGTPIHAAADGTVIYARVSPSWGGRTIIQHSPTVKTAYGHQSMFLVKEGQVVKQGQVIGLSGTTGWSTGCHLHFDVIVNDRYVDPAPYLGFPPSNSASVPFSLVSQVSVGLGSAPSQVVDDGDVPISEASETPVPSIATTTTPSAPTSSSGTAAAPKPATPGSTTAPGTAPTTAPKPTSTSPAAQSPTPSTPSPTSSSPSPSPSPTTSTPPPTSGTPAPSTSTTPSTPAPPTSTTPPPAPGSSTTTPPTSSTPPTTAPSSPPTTETPTPDPSCSTTDPTSTGTPAPSDPSCPTPTTSAGG